MFHLKTIDTLSKTKIGLIAVLSLVFIFPASAVFAALTFNNTNSIISDGALTLTTGSNQNIILTTGKGYVGIGTTSPSYPLSVNGVIQSMTGGFRFPDGTTQTSAAAAGLNGGGTVNYLSKFTGMRTIGNSQIFDDGTNVGIGTTSPRAKLEIAGTNQLGANIADLSKHESSLFLNASNSGVGSGGELLIGGMGNNHWFSSIKGLSLDGTTNSIGDLAFSTRNAIGDTFLRERMRITASGNVGIGTTTPAGLLQIGSSPTNGKFTLGVGQNLTDPNANSLFSVIESEPIITINSGTASVVFNTNTSMTVNGTNNLAYIFGVYDNSNYSGSGTIGNLIGVTSDPQSSGSGTIDNLIGFYNISTTSGTVTNSWGVQVYKPNRNSGTIVNDYGIFVDGQTQGSTSNVNLMLGADYTVPASGNYSIYSSSAYQSYFAGNMGIGTTNPASLLQVNGPLATAIAFKTSNYTITATDSSIIASGSGTTITLPTAVGVTGRYYTIKRVDGTNSITVATTSSQTIDGATTVSLSTNYQAITVQSDGSNWEIIGKN